MMKIINLPINQTSFGFCGYNILNELYERKYDDFILQDIGQPQLTSFDKRRDDLDFIAWLNNKRDKFLSKYKRDQNSIRLWHINGSEACIGDNRTLFTFNESDSLTETEVNILNSYNNIIVSCNYSKNVFEESGVTVPVHVIPLGFDKLHFNNNLKRKIPNEVCSLTVNGKLEKRKGHFELIPLLKKKFGNNHKFIINLCVYNIHLKPEQNSQILNQLLQGQKPFNFNIHPFYYTLSELNDLYSNTDIILNGSYAESFSIPDFTCAALGKYAVVNNAAGVQEWSNDKNCILVNPDRKEPMVDNMFFPGTGDFNIGNWSVWDNDNFSSAIDIAIEKWKSNKINQEGLLLQDQFSWKNSVDKLLNII